MILEVIKAEYISDYKLNIWFNNGKKKIVNLKNTIYNDHRDIFKPLRSIDYFCNFQIVLNTISWQNGLDLAPEYLFELETSNEFQIV
jgi:hypothetical protein